MKASLEYKTELYTFSIGFHMFCLVKPIFKINPKVVVKKKKDNKGLFLIFNLSLKRTVTK